MGWCGLVCCGSSVGPGGDQAGFGALARHLPRPPGVRFGGSGGGPSAVDLRLRWLWMQASPAAVLTVVQGAARGGSGRGGQAGVGDSREHRDGRTLDGHSVRLVSQHAALREILRLRDGAYGLPRPPEWWRRDYGFRQARGGSAEAGYGDERGLVVVLWLMGVLIAGELGGLCQRVSRWPGHAALPRGWWKGHSDFVNPNVVLAAYALGVRALRSGLSEGPSTTDSRLGSRRWRRCNMACMKTEKKIQTNRGDSCYVIGQT